MATNPKFWLMKSEPDVFSIDDLKAKGKTLWDGVRNYQARNFMTNDMKVGDQILFYHSNANPPGIAGLAKVIAPAKPDPTAQDKNSQYFDEKSTAEKPRWFCVEVGFERKFQRYINLDEIRNHPELKNMLVIKRGQRLSIQPVTPGEFRCLCHLGQN